MTDLMERVDDRGDGGTNRPLPILLSITLGGSAVLLFAMASGHLRGMQATIGVVAALAQVALAVGALTQTVRGRCSAPPRPSTRRSPSTGWRSKARTRSPPCPPPSAWRSLGSPCVVGVALAIRPALGSTWPSSASVFGSLVPVGIVGLTIGGLFGSVGALNTPSAAAPAAGSRRGCRQAGPLDRP